VKLSLSQSFIFYILGTNRLHIIEVTYFSITVTVSAISLGAALVQSNFEKLFNICHVKISSQNQVSVHPVILS
jgi:hypothetical protein